MIAVTPAAALSSERFPSVGRTFYALPEQKFSRVAEERRRCVRVAECRCGMPVQLRLTYGRVRRDPLETNFHVDINRFRRSVQLPHRLSLRIVVGRGLGNKSGSESNELKSSTS